MRHLFTALIALAIIGMSFPAEARIKVTSSSDSKPEFSSSVSCAKCHQDIYNYWKESLHAQAIEDYIFQAAFMMAVKERGDAARELCLGCHAPTTTINNDLTLQEPITNEAITCDFCHRISGITYDKNASAVTLTAGKEKHGPLDLSGKGAPHKVVQSDYFMDSKLCATCHQWSNEHGVPIFDTYEEWRKGPYAAKGVECQNCHMPLVEGSIVRTKDKKPGEMINSHNLSGGHSIIQVAAAASVSITSVKWVPGGLEAMVEVANTGSGHMIPTGIPSRSLVLDVQLLDSAGKVVETSTQEFRKIVVDENHSELTRDADIILNGVGISKDNRIPPGEKVTVPFQFAASSKEKYLVKATLTYNYRPLILKEEEINIEMGSATASP